MYSFSEVQNYDPDLAKAMADETQRQRDNIELIASENLVSKAVMAAMGSTLTNKYAEGYPGKRYYGGCEHVDVVEDLARDRAMKLFGCTYANVQPHSGAQANMTVFFALMQPGDTFMGMNLDHGGHLTHGSPVNFSGKYFNCVPYGVNSDGYIDYDEVERIAKECKPKLIVAGASAYARKIDFKRFREIADEVGAYLMVDMAHIAGLVAAGYHESPIPYAHVTTTTTHKTLRGPRGGMILSSKEFAEEHKLNKALFPGIQGGPLMHVIAAKAVCFKEALDPAFKEYGKNIIDNAQALANGLIALSGALISHYLGLSDQSFSNGTLIYGLAAVIIGEAIFGKRNVALGLTSAVVGSVIYKIIVAFVIDVSLFGKNSENLMKLTCAIIVAITLVVPEIKHKFENAKSKKEARKNA